MLPASLKSARKHKEGRVQTPIEQNYTQKQVLPSMGHLRKYRVSPSAVSIAFRTVSAVIFRSICLKINPVITSAASAASPMTKMQGSPRTTTRHADDGGRGLPLHFGHRGVCASSRLDHSVDLQASQMKFSTSSLGHHRRLLFQLSVDSPI